MVTNIHEHKRYYYTFDNSLLFTGEHSEHYTNLSTLNHNVRSFRVSNRMFGIMHTKSLNFSIVLIIPGHSAEKFSVRAVDIVNPGIQ